MTSPKQPRFSWKKPWAFNDIHEMRKYITEREVYKRLKILERHSSFKKPYWNFKSHPYGELYYMPPGYNPGYRPGGWNWVPPDGGSGPGAGDCTMACLGSILDCKNGGCAAPICICGEPPYTLEILATPSSDHTWVEDGINPLVCISPIDEDLSDEYPEIIVNIRDAIGQESIVVFPLVNCVGECCDEPIITGSETVAAGASWTGTVTPPCPGGEVACGGGACAEVSVSINEAGSEITGNTTGSACGSFYVTLTDPCGLWAVNSSAVRVTGANSAWCMTTGSPDCAAGEASQPDACVGCVGSWSIDCHGSSGLNFCSSMDYQCLCDPGDGCINICSGECTSDKCAGGWGCDDVDNCTCIEREYNNFAEWKCKVDCTNGACVGAPPTYPCYRTTICTTFCSSS